METKTFIVPHDFTQVADNALNHAVSTAEQLNAQVYVLHVVPKEKSIADAEKKLNQIIAGIKTNVTLIPRVRVGNIFEDIGEFAAEHHAELIFMGTHGVNGWQHLTGSNALKVITHSEVPFIIVQERKIRQSGYNNIVVPLDLNKETKQKLAMVAHIAQYFNSKVHVVTLDENDEFLKHKVKANIQFAKKFFSERGIEITATLAQSSGFDKEVIKHAIAIDADLIAIMNMNKNNVFGSILPNYESNIITNEAQIPTLVVNPLEAANGSSFKALI